MLGNKARPRRLNSKGNLNGSNSDNTSNSNTLLSLSPRSLHLDTIASRFGRALYKSIPVLSIFALVGICNYLISPELLRIKVFSAPSAFAKCEPIVVTCPSGTTLDSYTACGCVPNSTATTDPTTSTDASASLTIDNNTIYDNINAFYGTTNYVSHKIALTASSVEGYALTITGPATISTKDANGGAVTGATTLSAANNKTPANMANNSWGYAWSAEGSTDSSLAYQSFTGSAQTLESNANVNSGQVNLNKKLTFAAKFAEDAKDGHYKASVNLSLTTTPRKMVAWNDMVYLQDMSAATCNSVPIGTEKILKDTRDQNTYTVAKLADGNCWMTQNLRLQEYMVISSADSDLNGIDSYRLPYSNTGNFASNNTTQQMRASVDNDYGAYYSWCAAAASTCQVGGTPIATNVDATSSICPKGWKLPKNGEYGVLYNKYYSSWTTNNSKNGRWFGAANTTDGGAFFPAAGYVYTSGLSNTGSGGSYWSRTAGSATSAYALGFASSGVYPASGNDRYFGYSVRCVAYSS